jgi:hypothetical protein
MDTTSQKIKLFIIYEKHEEDIASDLKTLFENWGLEAFYCRQEIKDAAAAEPYRKILRDNLNNACLVILLVSREFQWSKYCQSEAGVAMTLDKARIIITVPPIEPRDITEICPVLEGYNVLVPAPKLQVRQLKAAVDRAIGTNLQSAVTTETDIELEHSINLALQRISDEYRITPFHRELINVWPSITERHPKARDSIVEHIKRSLRASNPVTDLALVGISLKFSLKLVTRALQEFAYETQHTGVKNQTKQLKIRLVHMNDHSHILRVINDNFDVSNIKENFHSDWTSTKELWKTYADLASIKHLEIGEPCGIDYIPPQLGICIDNSTFFSGRCAFEKVGVEYHLLVGELEYIYFTDAEPRGAKAISEFRQALKVYENSNHNSGIALARDAEDWIKHLMDGVGDSLTSRKVTLISQTATKFAPLIEKVVSRGLHVDIYLQDPTSDLPPDVSREIKHVPGRLERMAARVGSKGGSFNIFYFSKKPAYRAALIGNELLGYQNYIPSGEFLNPGPLRLIVTKASSQFEDIKNKLLDPMNQGNALTS